MSGFPNGITPRQAEVLDALCKAGHTKAASRLIGVEPQTFSTHLKRIYPKLGVDCAVRAAVMWTGWRHSQRAEA